MASSAADSPLPVPAAGSSKISTASQITSGLESKSASPIVRKFSSLLEWWKSDENSTQLMVAICAVLSSCVLIKVGIKSGNRAFVARGICSILLLVGLNGCIFAYEMPMKETKKKGLALAIRLLLVASYIWIAYMNFVVSDSDFLVALMWMLFGILTLCLVKILGLTSSPGATSASL